MIVKKVCHYLIASIVWGIPGIIITIKGIMAYCQLLSRKWWLYAITSGVLVAFYIIFNRIVERYSTHIADLPPKSNIGHTFPTRGWVLIIFMLGLGFTLRFIEGVPVEFTASFYSGLGPMLLLSALRFLKRV